MDVLAAGQRVGLSTPGAAEKLQWQGGSQPRERGSRAGWGEEGGGVLLAMRLGGEEGHPKGFVYPVGKREAPQANNSGLHLRRPVDGKKEAMPVL